MRVSFSLWDNSQSPWDVVAIGKPCPTRAFTDVLLMTPNVGDVKLLSGFANCGWVQRIEKFGTKLKAALLNGAVQLHGL